MPLVVLRAFFVAVSVGIAVLIFNSEAMKQAPSWVPWGVLAGMLVLPAVVIGVDGLLRRKNLTTITAVYFGLLVGVFLTYVAMLALAPILPLSDTSPVRQWLPLILGAVLCYVCTSLLLQTRDDFRFLIPFVEFARDVRGLRPNVLDATSIVDGRIADLAESGIFESRFVVPTFVLDELVAAKLGFAAAYDVTGQTYTRKVDSQVVAALGGVAESAHKAGNDLRLAAAWSELEEPFEQEQVGSSAMPYKRNPMRAERMCGLARFVMGLQATAGQTAAVQWMERTLDDSAPRRLVLPQAFLATDAVLVIYANVAKGLVVLPGGIARNLADHLPFLASEKILMAATTAGGDRQTLHEALRTHSHAATARIRDGHPNDLPQRLAADPLFQGVDIAAAMRADDLAGRAAEQVEDFVAEAVEVALATCPARGPESALKV